jgi:hypothetical protein
LVLNAEKSHQILGEKAAVKSKKLRKRKEEKRKEKKRKRKRPPKG